MSAPRVTPSGFGAAEWSEACGETTALLQRLLRIDTSNPPGREQEAAESLRQELARDGLATELLHGAPGRSNLLCRLPAATAQPEPGLLLASHLDVVPAGDPARWTHPPFGGVLADGMIWGRGAIDMKNMVAMSAMVLRLLARRGVRLRRELLLAAVADEEAGCRHGSSFLVEQHPDRVRAGFALGEVGGCPMRVGRARFLPVEVAEKGICWLRLTARGPAGHGSQPRPDSAPLRLARALTRLGSSSLPRHLTPVAEAMVHTLAAPQPLPLRHLLRLILVPGVGAQILARFPDRGQARTFHALLHNTVSPTVLRAGEPGATNVIPESASVELDARLLPGQRPEDLIGELRTLLADDALELELLRAHPPTSHAAPSPLWDCLEQVMRRRHPDLRLVPTLIPAFTDGAYFSRLGLLWYGFAPVWIDPASGLRYGDLFHGIDERIPEDGLHWGLGLLYEVVHAFCATG
jgi:acetylornithine deacetylase/succinyl-diaminopimelate desuccinylase-like protein